MKKLLCFCVLFLVSIHIPNAYSAERIVEMLNKREDGQKMVYSQDIVNIDINDTLYFEKNELKKINKFKLQRTKQVNDTNSLENIMNLKYL